MEYAIEFNNVRKSFKRGERAAALRDAIPNTLGRLIGRAPHAADKKFWALKDVSFKVKKGEILGIIGPNGAGKTTALRLIAGIMRPNQGSIIKRGRISCLIAAGAGFHMQFTGRENIYLNGAIMGMSKREIDKKFDSIVEFAGYGFSDYVKFVDTPVKRYSSGMFIRLGFAIAAHLEPDILLVDEILAVGDIVFQQKCLEYMNNLKKSNATVIMVSHNMRHISNYCDRAILFKEARIAAEGEPRKLVSIFEREVTKKTSWFKGEHLSKPKPGGGVILSNVKFEDLKRIEGEPQLDYGQPIVVSFDYNCLNYPLEDVSFSLVIYRKDIGCKCFGIFSHMHNCYPKTKEGHVKLTVEAHNLIPGDYIFDVEIRSLKGNTPLAAYREPEIFIREVNKYLIPQLCGIYQPKEVSWDVS